ncbi:unnamed protein product, partial [Allacma fusca]
LSLFGFGFLMNVYHDFLLSKLKLNQRKNSSGSGTKYVLPVGGLFEIVSTPNFLGEIIEWWGLALVTRGYLQVLFAVSASMILLTRGWQHHKFYKELFDMELGDAIRQIHQLLTLSTVLFLFITFPYGRYAQRFKLSGIMIPGQLPFRILGINFLQPLFLMVFTSCKTFQGLNVVCVSLYAIHYFHRSVIYTKWFPTAASMPVETGVAMIFFCSAHVFCNLYDLMNDHVVLVHSTTVLGLSLFGFGFLMNVYHDFLLSKLKLNQRKNSSGSGTKYALPVGGLFEIVSTPNFLGEIIEWWGMALVTRGYLQVLFAVSASVILLSRGWRHHKFYKELFGSKYPKNRTAVIPFVL